MFVMENKTIENIVTPAKTHLTDEETFALIREYEQHQCLWQKSHKDFKSHFKKSDALEKISATTNLNCEIIKDKLRSLRTIYFQNAQKIKKGKSGSGGGTQPRWKFFYALNFLQSEVAESGIVDSLLSQSSTSIHASPLPSEKDFSQQEKFNKSSKKRVYEDDRQACWSAIVESIRPQNANEEFGQYVAGSLNQIKDKSLAENVRCQIRLILCKAISASSENYLQNQLNGSEDAISFESVIKEVTSDL